MNNESECINKPESKNVSRKAIKCYLMRQSLPLNENNTIFSLKR